MRSEDDSELCSIPLAERVWIERDSRLDPYLAQLHLLRNTLRKENDPILNDLNSGDLVRAGLMPAAAARLSRRPPHICSIGEKKIFVCDRRVESYSNSSRWAVPLK
jgi:hypothetical protein